jgi:hypothetical protein
MATPAPPISTPAASARTRDWVRTAEPGSAFSGLGRGGRGGGGRGRSRGGGRGRGGPPANAGGASSSRTPSTAEKPTPSESSASKPAPSGSGAATATAQKPSVPPATPARSKAHGRRPSRSVVPTVVVGPSSPSVDVPTATSAPRPSNRRRRSQQLNSKGNGNAAGLKVNVPSLDDNLLRPQNRLAVPHSAPLPSKDTPPHLAG